jgi:microcystin-dependent protein
MSQDISKPGSPAYASNYVTKVPSLSDDADIQQAINLYHFGEDSEPTKSIIYHLNRIESGALSSEMTDINTLAANNLDSIISTGFYIQSSNAQAQDGLNYPSIGVSNNERYAGALKVVATGTTDATKLVYQEYHMSGTNSSSLTNNVFWRTRFPNSSNQYIWSSWKRLVDTNHTHDDRYYTRQQTFNPDNVSDISALGYTKSQADSKFLTLQTLPSGAPVGSVSIFAADTIPSGWLSCRGQLVSRIEYADLFSVIGVRYGNGDGSTTFALPNLQARVPVGISDTDTDFDTVGKTGGEKSVTLTEAQMPSHNHSQNSHNHGANSSGGGHGHNSNIGSSSPSTSNTGNHSHNLNAVTGYFNTSRAGGTFGTRQPNGAVNFGTSNTGAHSHNVNSHNHSISIFSSGSEHSHSISIGSTTASNNSTGGNQAHTNLQPYITMHYIIKATP